MLKLLNVTLLFFVAVVKCSLTNADIKDARISEEPGKTRIVFELDKAANYKVFTLPNPHRLVVDINDDKQSASLKELLRTKLVKDVRSGKRGQQTRLVFELAQRVEIKDFTIKDRTRYRVVFDLFTDTSSTVNQQKVNTQKSQKAVTKPSVIKQPEYSSLRDVVILIDAGHGGKDPGAIGPRGTYEKTVVLEISKKLASYINNQPGLKAVMTRRGDYYVPLRSRLKKAREQKGDLFISVHADAFKNRRHHGSSVYALSQRGASSEMARWLAEKENYSELSGIDLNDKSDILRSVLIDLSQTATIGASLNFGQEILDELKKVNKLHNDKVEQARFVVLKSPDIPSLLVETGFISNRREEMKLKSPSHQRKLAKAMLYGVLNYLRMNPIRGTKFAKSPSTYKVRPGDSLSTIAEKFNISIHRLKQVNIMSRTTIFPGQILKIPTST